MITAAELRRITSDTIHDKVNTIKETIMRPLEREIEAAAIENAKANTPMCDASLHLPSLCRRFSIHTLRVNIYH